MKQRRVPFLLSAMAGALSLAVAGSAFAQAKIQLRWGHYLPDSPTSWNATVPPSWTSSAAFAPEGR